MIDLEMLCGLGMQDALRNQSKPAATDHLDRPKYVPRGARDNEVGNVRFVSRTDLMADQKEDELFLQLLSARPEIRHQVIYYLRERSGLRGYPWKYSAPMLGNAP